MSSSTSSSNSNLLSVVLNKLRTLPEDVIALSELLQVFAREIWRLFLFPLLVFIVCVWFISQLCIGIKSLIFPLSAHDLYQEGVGVLKKETDTRLAIRKFKQCIQTDPNYLAAYLTLADVQLERENVSDCINTLSRGLKQAHAVPPAAVVSHHSKNEEKGEIQPLSSSSSGNNNIRNEEEERRITVKRMQVLKMEAEALQKHGTKGHLAQQLNVGHFGMSGATDGIRARVY
eukprot:CAMPEP_0195525650 /NCGR_PEP_ID=MMETSP0794_2-20130614/26190_1 /TAXON_ID=515487 /ORGANISM="Stephanopyxis turris, Strain CCMP 815" /LENGTH=230 /DNA_ID=CAMNT_0040656151 /DNA_START=83 /DNA_END=775 /DNA_ORIENTATION=+